MTTSSYKLRPLNNSKAKDESLFSGVWLRWGALNTAEKVVCTNIALIPAWWFIGLLEYMPLLLFLGIGLYEWRQYGKLRLKYPSFVVISLFAFYGYYFTDIFLLFFNEHPAIALPSGDPRNPTLNELIKTAFQFSIPSLVWYIQSNNIRVRLEAVAWACSVCIIQILVLWIVVETLFPIAFDSPPRSLYAALTGKPKGYIDGMGSANYLQFYDRRRRFIFFFGNNQPAAAFLGLVILIALDLKNRLWSLLLLAACVFLLILTETRSVWVALPAVALLHILFTANKVVGNWLVFSLIALVSFSTFSVPPITNSIFAISNDTATAVGDYRAGSTEVRSEVYTQTLEEIPNKLFWGHKVKGEEVSTAVGNGTGPEVGTHSFILGDLLYQGGLVAAGIFTAFWTSLFMWFYNTRIGRPQFCFSVLILFSLISAVSFLHWMLSMGTLLCMVIRRPVIKPVDRSLTDV
jgi:hypothetical protein